MFVLLMLFASVAMAQKPIAVTGETQMLNGRKYYVHVLQQGQTVYSIAKAYGVNGYDAVTRKDIHKLSVGDTVWLPFTGKVAESKPANAAPKYRYIKVESGQTLYSISREYGVSIEDIHQLNPELKDGGLKSGQTLRIPDSGKASSADRPNPAAAANKPAAAQPTKPATTPTKIEIRNRIDPTKVYVSVMLPLNLSKIDSISTSKFDIEQRGKKSYKSFEFIQFYEGLLMGLERLERRGCQVVLNVVDVEGASAKEVEQAFKSHDVANSDLVIALLQRQPFEKAAALAKENKVFIVNPISDRSEIVKDNPYVVKCMPSEASYVATVLRAVRQTMPNAHLYLIHSNYKAEANLRGEFQKQLDAAGDIRYTLFDWSANSKFTTALKQTPNSVIVSLYDQGRDKNRIFANNLLNRISAMKTNTPRLITINDYTKDISDVDFAQLQHASYHTFYTGFDDADAVHRDFMEAFRERYKTEPLNGYAGMANDIIIYFVTGLTKKGSAFWENPNQPRPEGVLFPMSFQRVEPSMGFENQASRIYRLSDYHFVGVEVK